MVTLRQMADAIENYLELHEDKEVISIGAFNGSSAIDYELHLCDIYKGPVGSNPYTGRDSIQLLKDGKGWHAGDHAGIEIPEESKVSEESEEFVEFTFTKPTAMKAYFDLEQELRKADDKPLYTRMAMLWGALSIMQRMGEIDKGNMKSLWNDFALDKLDLE